MKKMKDQFNWDDFKVEEIEKKHEIREKAKRDGMGDEPPTNSEGLSVTEFPPCLLNANPQLTE